MDVDPTSCSVRSRLPTWFRVLNLENYSVGTIPSALVSITSLKKIDLSYNKLSGSIASTIFNVSSLQIIDLSFNRLDGNLPTDLINHLPDLKELYLSRNQLYGQIPGSLFNCRQLEVLSLSSNNFIGNIPINLGNLTILNHLDLSSNILEGHIPSSICNCTSLEAINFRENNFEGALPSDIGLFLPNLLELQLRENELRGTIPSSISNASKLTLLDLSYNSFTGHIPMTIGSLKNLQKLDLGHNQLTSESYTPGSSLINSLSNNRHLRKIVLSGNPLDTMLPVSIGNLSTSLEYLELTDCRLQGNIPTEVGSLSSLVSLKLGNNALTGVIPDTIRLLKSLQSLQLHGNKLRGVIPYDLCMSKNLFELFLGGNELSGAIPECLSNLTALRNLSLSSNRLASTIPSSLWSLVDILAINLSSNSLQGSLSSGIGNLKALVEIDLSNNDLSGQIPYKIGDLKNLAHLSLAVNRLQGPIPERLSLSVALGFLDLSQNNLSGVIPKSLENLRYLAYFNVSFNELEGEIPSAGSFTNFTAQSYVMNKALCGAARLQVRSCRTDEDMVARVSDFSIAKLVDAAVQTRTMASIGYMAPESFSDRKTMAEVESEILKIKTHFLIDAQLMECEDMEIGRSGVRSCSLRDTELTECEELGIDSRISLQELKLATDGFSERNLLELGKSSFVYIGTPKDMPLVAIKIFNLQKGGLEKFKVQCRALSSIRHRNVVKIVKYCSDVGFKALVMEYMPNGSLQSHLRSGMNTLNFLQRLDIMINVASGLCYLHSMRVIHCNLNPTNVLLDKDMVARISGFSFAKCLEEGFAAIKTSRMAVAPGYMTPEYESTKTVSEKTDVYSFGILLMETFTVIRPAEEKNWRSRILFSLQSVDKIADLNFLQTEMEDFAASAAHTSGFLRLIPRLIYCCTTELPEERKTMTEVETELARLKKVLLSRSILSKIGSRQVPSATAVRGMCDIPDDSDQDSGEQGLYSVARYGNQDPLPEAHPN
ncbi:hypothetical protein V6N11_015315 [Hibiscus sabdariffa]|uniref:Protein kinase domain-containing protein n=1 Tax=Hibiscus sabdariffa TaxID=183260 RepID=A0ABR2TRP9_9ROSI